jgi:hypothetical protein
MPTPSVTVTESQKSDAQDLQPARRYGWKDRLRIKDRLATRQSLFWIVVEVAALVVLAYLFWPLSR